MRWGRGFTTILSMKIPAKTFVTARISRITALTCARRARVTIHPCYGARHVISATGWLDGGRVLRPSKHR